MTHGAPDWSKYRREAASFSLEDLAELAVRLGSIVQLDRRGDVVFLEDFESGLQRWLGGFSGGAGDIAVDTTRCLYGNQSCKLQTAAGFPATATITRWLSRPVVAKWGLETHVDLDSGLTYFLAEIVRYTGSQQQRGVLKYLPGSGDLEYLDSAGSYQTLISDLDLVTGVFAWHPFKLVVDWSAGEYVRAIVGDQEVSMDGLALEAGVSSVGAGISIAFQVQALGAAAGLAYVDAVIVTRDEP